MLRNVIGMPTISEIYLLSKSMKRGTVVVKDYTLGKAVKANSDNTDVYLVDYDYQPTGAYANCEISDYTDTADIVKKRGVLLSYPVGAQFATDQVEDKDNKLEKGKICTQNDGKICLATTGQVGSYKYVGVYFDGEHELQCFQKINPVTLSTE